MFNEVQNDVSNSVELPIAILKWLTIMAIKITNYQKVILLIPNHCVARHESGNVLKVMEILCIIDVFHDVYPV